MLWLRYRVASKVWSHARRSGIAAGLRRLPIDRESADLRVLHGGAWLGGEAKNYADSGELFVNAGANYIVLDFIAIKEAGGDLRVMADQVRRGVAWAYRNIATYDGDPDRSTSAAIRPAATCAASP